MNYYFDTSELYGSLSTTKRLFGFDYTRAEQRAIDAAENAAKAMFEGGYGKGARPGSHPLDLTAYVSTLNEPPKPKPKAPVAKPQTKVCTHCKRILPLDKFYVSPNHADGLQRLCVDCMREYNRTHKRKTLCKKS
jgi:hypothetical protein